MKGDWDVSEDFALGIGIVLFICLLVVSGYIIYKTSSAEGWLSILLIPVGVILYIYYIRERINYH